MPVIDAWTGIIVAAIGGLVTLVTLIANGASRRANTTKTISELFSSLASELRQELSREREKYALLEARVLALEDDVSAARACAEALAAQLRALGHEPVDCA